MGDYLPLECEIDLNDVESAFLILHLTQTFWPLAGLSQQMRILVLCLSRSVQIPLLKKEFTWYVVRDSVQFTGRFGENQYTPVWYCHWNKESETSTLWFLFPGWQLMWETSLKQTLFLEALSGIKKVGICLSEWCNLWREIDLLSIANLYSELERKEWYYLEL